MQDLVENKELIKNDIEKTNKAVLDEYDKHTNKYQSHKQALNDLIQQRQQKKKLDSLMMAATLSPGGKLIFPDPENKMSLGPDQISNPFIEKSDIVNHKMKIHKKDLVHDNIQTMY